MVALAKAVAHCRALPGLPPASLLRLMVRFFTVFHCFSLFFTVFSSFFTGYFTGYFTGFHCQAHTAASGLGGLVAFYVKQSMILQYQKSGFFP